MVKNTNQNNQQFGWYIPCLAVINAHVGHTQYRLF